jgi:MFS family permease
MRQTMARMSETATTSLNRFEPSPAGPLRRLPSYPWMVVAVTCIGAFIGQVDASIVQLALPTLEQAFDAPLSAVSWVAIGYQLSFAAILPVYARLAEIAGRKLMYLIGFALFAVASLLCGMAGTLWQLIAFRVLLGLSGAMLGANSVVILVKAAGPERQGAAMGVFAAAQAIGVSVGPLLAVSFCRRWAGAGCSGSLSRLPSWGRWPAG